jgi:predicted acyltransferase
MTTATLKPLPLADTTLTVADGEPPPHLVEPIKAERLVSLDIFRGITIATMLLVNNPGSWSHVHAPLLHADWHGWTMTDLVFPFFLFIVGVAIPFSMAKRTAVGAMTRGQILAGIWARAVSLVLLGLLLAAMPRGGEDLPPGYNTLRVLRVLAELFCWVGFVALLFPWPWRRVSLFAPIAVALLFLALYWAILLANRQALSAGIGEGFKFGGGILTPWRMRFPGVLQRIGVCYGIAATIALFFGWRTILASAVLFMGIYSALMLAAPYPGHETASLTKEDNLARKIDEKVFGFDKTGGRNHNYSYPDNEGLISTLPAIANVLLGILVGMRLRSEGRTPVERGASVLAWGVAVACLGIVLGWWLMPINKVIWTPSYTVLTVGLGMLGLGAAYYVADIKGRRAWALPFRIYGMNAILAFVLAGGVLARVSSWVEFKNPRTDETTHTIPYLRGEVGHGMHVVSDWLERRVSYPPNVFDSPKNVSLAQAITYVLIILIPLTILYFSRVFIKV